MAHMADEELAEAIRDVQMEALAEEMMPEEVMVAEMMAEETEAIVDVLEALAEESAAADNGESIHEGVPLESLSRQDLVMNTVLGVLGPLEDVFDLEVETLQDLEEFSEYAVALVSKAFADLSWMDESLMADSWKEVLKKNEGLEADVKAMVWQVVHDHYHKWKESLLQDESAEEESQDESVEDLEVHGKTNIAVAEDVNARYSKL